MTMNPKRQACLNKARQLVGARWRHRGRTPWALDCVGLLVMSLRAGGLTLIDDTHYGREPWKDQLQQRLQKHFGDPIAEAFWQPADIAVFKAPQRGPCHVGLLGDYLYEGFSLIHAHAQHNVTEHALDARWQRLLVEVYSPWAI